MRLDSQLKSTRSQIDPVRIYLAFRQPTRHYRETCPREGGNPTPRIPRRSDNDRHISGAFPHATIPPHPTSAKGAELQNERK